MTAIALTIAGSDSGGGAGIQADLKTFAALGVYGACAVTAVTAQNTEGVRAIHDVPPEIVAAQIDAVFADLAVGAVKIGMLSRRATIEVVADALARHAARNVVLDPVMAASTGARLLAEDAVEALLDLLVPRAWIVTPNLPEAARLAGGMPARSEPEMEAQARAILARGARNVLIKGGHGTGAESVDLLVAPDRVLRLAAPRIATTRTHGSGCTFSSALAAGLAQGRELDAAARAAKDYVTAAIVAADRLQVGRGRGPLHHFHTQERAERSAPESAQAEQACGAGPARPGPEATRRNT